MTDGNSCGSDDQPEDLLDEDIQRAIDDRWKRPADLVFQKLIDLVEASEVNPDRQGEAIRFEVTLMVAGAVVSGIMVPYAVWANEVAASIGAGDDTGKVTESYRKLFGVDDRGKSTDDQDDDVMPWDREVVHLIETRFIHDSRMLPTNGGTPWRGRLSAISGWWMGRLMVGEN